MDWLNSLTHADLITLVLILLIVLVIFGLPAWIGLLREFRRGQNKQENRRLDNEGKPLDAITVLAQSITDRTDLEREREKSHMAEVGQYQKTIEGALEMLSKQHDDYMTTVKTRTEQMDKNLEILVKHAEFLSTIQLATTNTQQIAKENIARLEAIQGHGARLEELKKSVGDVSDAVSKLPDEMQRQIKPLIERMDKIDADVRTLVADQEALRAQVLAALSKMPPTTLPEPPKPIDATQKLNDTLPSAEADITRKVPPLFGNGLPTTPPESKP